MAQGMGEEQKEQAVGGGSPRLFWEMAEEGFQHQKQRCHLTASGTVPNRVPRVGSLEQS